jgi:hypothetical protein
MIVTKVPTSVGKLIIDIWASKDAFVQDSANNRYTSTVTKTLTDAEYEALYGAVGFSASVGASIGNTSSASIQYVGSITDSYSHALTIASGYGDDNGRYLAVNGAIMDRRFRSSIKLLKNTPKSIEITFSINPEAYAQISPKGCFVTIQTL